MISIKYTDSTVDVTQSISSKRFEFLGNNPLITKKRICFENNKITQIETLAYQNVDWKVWTEKRDSLVKWIDANHKEFSGFIFDLTQKGAEDYLKAIDLYQSTHQQSENCADGR